MRQRRIAGLVWGSTWTGIGGGFLLGVLIGGGIGIGIVELSTIIEILSTAPLLVLGSFALAWKAGRKVQAHPLPRYGLAVVAVAAGFLIGFAGGPEMAEEGPDDVRAWLGDGVGLVGVVLLIAAQIWALTLSLQRFPVSENAPPEPTLEERLFGRT